jgi:predicted ATP-grasp superfamily ATP-dependent carboligase
LATGDRYALFLAKQQDLLASKYCFVTPTYAALDAIIDKAKLYQTAKRSGFRHPRFHVVADPQDIEAAIANVPTPCYVKPALAHEWRPFKNTKVERADTQVALRHILETFIERGLVAVPQEIIPGSDSEVFSVATYIDRSGKVIAWRTKRKLRQYPPSAGDASSQEICNEPEVADLGLRLLAVAEHRGPATVEFRRDARDGNFVLMEINARTILGQEMITGSGFDVPLTAYRDAKGEPMPAVGAPSFVRWVSFGPDFRAFRELRSQGQISTLRWLESLLGCRSFAYFALDDPWPFVTRTKAWVLMWTRRILERGGN